VTPTRTIRTSTLTTPTRTPTPRTRASARALARCLEPVEAEEFFSAYWEQQPLGVSRAEEGRFDDLLSVADVERLVCAGGLRVPAFRLVKDGGQIAVHEYASDLAWRPQRFSDTADPDRVAAAFEAGATVVLQALHHNWLPLARFCRALEAELGHPVQANSYYTPRRAQGFAVHHDTHDVLVLQVAGEKQWLVYEPLLDLPLKHQRYSKSLGEHGPPVLEMTLRAGDTLYLPRGWLHEARTSDTDSLHITVGINNYTWIDALKAALAACEDDVEFRRTVPEHGELHTDLLERLAAHLEPEAVARRMRSHFVTTRRAVLDSQLEEVRTLDSLDADTLVERRSTVIADLDATTLVFEGKRVSFPDYVREELEFVLAAEDAFCARDLPGDLDGASRLVLLRRLIREGFARRSAARA
jgi:ribosomal protein L16 Arg81 hydroxylase